MPFLTGSEGETELSWDGYDYPTVNLSSWKPDPDCVPEPGGMPDFRFTRVSRDQRVGFSGYSFSESAHTRPPPPPKEKMATLSSVGASSTSVPRDSEPSHVPTEEKVTSTTAGGWPTPVSRAACGQALEPSSALRQPVMSSQGSRTASALKAAPTTCIQSLKGTMETLSAHSSTGRSCSQAVSSRSGTLRTSDKASDSSLPSKLVNMRRDPGQELAPLHRAQAQPVATSASKVLPPHLRKRQPASSVETIRTTQMSEHPTEEENEVHSLTDRVNTVWITPDNEHPTEAKPKLQQANESLNYSLEAETRTIQRSENIDLQKAIVESLISKNLASSVQEHDRHLDSKLIGIMEEELDLGYRTTHRQLRDMSEKEFKLHFQHTKKMHKHHWEKHNNIKSGEADANITLASFQEQEQLRYGQRKASLLE